MPFLPLNEWDVFGVTQPPCASWLMVVGDWFIFITTGLPGRLTRFPVGTVFPIQRRTVRKSLLRVRYPVFVFLFLFVWLPLNQNSFLMTAFCGFSDGFRTQGRPTSASWIACRKVRGSTTVTGAKSSTVRSVMNKQGLTFALPANVWWVFILYTLENDWVNEEINYCVNSLSAVTRCWVPRPKKINAEFAEVTEQLAHLSMESPNKTTSRLVPAYLRTKLFFLKRTSFFLSDNFYVSAIIMIKII